VNRYLAEAGETRRIDAAYIEEKLPDILDFCRTYLGVDPVKEPMPIQPTAHYAMGGIPTNLDAQVLSTPDGTVIQGLYAAGEVACVSVHGANRLGTNSLTDLIVFGRRSGMHMLDYVQGGASFVDLPPNPEAEVAAELERIRTASGKVKPHSIRSQMQQVMMDYVGVFRTEEGITSAIETLRELKHEFQTDLVIDDRGKRFNTDMLEAWELGCLLDVAEMTAICALERRESRGAHSREDYKERDDQKFLVHTFAWQEEDGIRTDHSKPVDLSMGYEPKARVY
jgi:succinate dehydrogenase / fumarate reductase flavoprotein subunit